MNLDEGFAKSNNEPLYLTKRARGSLSPPLRPVRDQNMGRHDRQLLLVARARRAFSIHANEPLHVLAKPRASKLTFEQCNKSTEHKRYKKNT